MPATSRVYIQPPEKYWSHINDEPVLPWPLWEDTFTAFLDSINEARAEDNELTDAAKNKYLISFLGTAGLRHLASDPIYEQRNTVDFDAFLDAAREMFHKPTNPVRAHFDFMQRTQGSSEPLDVYLRELRTLIQKCTFPLDMSKKISGTDLTEYLLGVQMVKGLYNKTTQEKLLAEPAVDFEKFQQIAQADESAKADAAQLATGHSGTTSVHRVFRGERKKGRRRPKHRGGAKGGRRHSSPDSHSDAESERSSQHSDNGAARSSTCRNCGSSSHHSNDRSCPAQDMRCYNCNKTGHLARCCDREPRAKGKTGEKSHRKMRAIVTREMDSQVPKHSRIQCAVRVTTASGESRVVSFVVDTGADASAIPYDLWERYFNKTHLASAPPLLSADGQSIPAHGKFPVTLSVADRNGVVELLVCNNQCRPTFGRDAMVAMGLTRIDWKTRCLQTPKGEIVPREEEEEDDSGGEGAEVGEPDKQHSGTVMPSFLPGVQRNSQTDCAALAQNCAADVPVEASNPPESDDEFTSENRHENRPC